VEFDDEGVELNGAESTAFNTTTSGRASIVGRWLKDVGGFGGVLCDKALRKVGLNRTITNDWLEDDQDDEGYAEEEECEAGAGCFDDQPATQGRYEDQGSCQIDGEAVGRFQDEEQPERQGQVGTSYDGLDGAEEDGIEDDEYEDEPHYVDQNELLEEISGLNDEAQEYHAFQNNNDNNDDGGSNQSGNNSNRLALDLGGDGDFGSSSPSSGGTYEAVELFPVKGTALVEVRFPAR